MSLTTMPLPSIESFKQEARNLGEEAADLAEKNLLRPARRLVREARDAVHDGTERTEEMIREQRDRASDWIVAHPFAAVGIALGAGLLMSGLLRSRR